MIRISTRKSPLALWQAEYVGHLLQQKLNLPFQLLPKLTEGDIKLPSSLAWQGGKGLFLKELQHELLQNNADISVHSMKDVPVQKEKGLIIAAILERHSPEDVFISNKFNCLDDLPKNSVIGTSSLRRQSQLLHHYPTLKVKLLRGNINTRLQKLDNDEYDGIILAKAGLDRMSLNQRIKQVLSINFMLPAVSQGAIGVECTEGNQKLIQQLKQLNHESTAICVNAERTVNQILGGHCHAPIGCFAKIDNGSQLTIQAMVSTTDGTRILHAKYSGHIDQALDIAKVTGKSLVKQGALSIIDSLNKF